MATAQFLAERPPRPRLDAIQIVLGAFALGAILLHDAAHLRAGRWWDAFWICNLAALLLGPALWLRSRTLVHVSFTWLLPGTVVWLLDALIAGSGILPTSWAVHLGGSAIAVYAVRRLGHAPRGWIAALGLLAVAVVLSLLALPAAANVNAAHAVPRGWGVLGGSRAVFGCAALVLATGVALAAHFASRIIARA